MEQLLESLLNAASRGGQVDQLFIGVNWIFALVKNERGEEQMGLAATPVAEHIALQSRFHYGFNAVSGAAASDLASLIQSSDQIAAAVGLAVLNALLKPKPELLEAIDAADWLVENGQNKNVAMIGRFPFADELQPVVKDLWIFELTPQPGEYHSAELARFMPNVDVLAITSTTLINHTLAGILALATPTTKIMLLGPSTPLHPVLANWGVDLLSGVQVVDKTALLASISVGVSFRKMAGVRRVSINLQTP